MKTKITIKTMLLFLAFTLQISSGLGQCLFISNYGSAQAPTTTEPVLITTCGFAGEYSHIIDCVAGKSYIFNATGGIGNYITIRQGTPDGTVLAHGPAPITAVPTVSGTLYFHLSTNSSCGTDSTCHSETVALASCLNNSSYGAANAPTNTELITITNCSYAGEYSILNNSVAGKTYEFNATGGTGNYITIRQGTYDGQVLAQGYAPVLATPTISGSLYFHLNTDSSCGTESICHTETVRLMNNIITKSSPIAGGTTTGGGVYNYGSTVTVSATPAAGYKFKNWMKGSTVVANTKNYSFTTNEDQTLVARFRKNYSGSGDNCSQNFYASSEDETGFYFSGPNYPKVANDIVVEAGKKFTMQSIQLEVGVEGGEPTGFILEIFKDDGSGHIGESTGITRVFDNSNMTFSPNGLLYDFYPKFTVFLDVPDIELTAESSDTRFWIAIHSDPSSTNNLTFWISYPYTTNPDSYPLYQYYTSDNSWHTDNPEKMESNMNVEGICEDLTYTIVTKSTPVAGGTTTGGGVYAHGSTATVKATAAAGYRFDSWLEGTTVVANTKNYSFTVTGDRTLKAKFKVDTNPSYTITTSSSPTVGGTTSGGGSYTSGSTVNLNAVAATGFAFLNWQESGTIVSTTANYSFTATANRDLVARFKAIANTTHTITTTAIPSAGGTTSGGGSYLFGKNITVKAVANTGYVFDSWLDGSIVVSTNKNYSFTVVVNRNLKAKFVKASYTITTTSTPVAGGTTSGGGSYLFGKNLTVKAVAATGYVFDSWMEGSIVVSTNKNYSFTVNANRNLKAKFVKASYTITTTSVPAAGGTTSGGGTYFYGKNLTVKAVAATGYVFDSWMQGTTVVSTNKNYSFTVTANRTLKAKFVKSGVIKNDTSNEFADTDIEKPSPLGNDSNSIHIYPNPFADFVWVNAGDALIQSIELFDFSGRLIYQKSINQESKFSIDTKGFVKGNYLLKVNTDNGTKTFKVFKK